MDRAAGQDGRKLGARVAERLQAEILQSGWPVGHLIGSEAQLCARYEVSRNTLREAVRLLEAYGAIRTRPGEGGGLVVAAEPRAFMARAVANYLGFVDLGTNELFDARLLLESTGAALAVDRADEVEARRLLVLAERIDEAPAGPIALGLHGELRRAVIDLVGNPAMALFMSALNELTVELSTVGFGIPDRATERARGGLDDGFERAAKHKRAIVEAIVARDPYAAHGAMVADIELRREALLHARARGRQDAAPLGASAEALARAGMPREVKLGQQLAARMARQMHAEGRVEGERLGTEPALQAQFGVGRPVLREAIRLLEAYGVVRSRRGRGCGLMAGRPDPSYTIDIAVAYLDGLRLPPALLHEAWSPIAGAAAGLAARRGDPDQTCALEHRLDNAFPPAGGLDVEALTACHLQIAQMSGNRVYALAGEIILGAGKAHWRAALRHADSADLRADLDQVVDAVQAGDGLLAQRHMAAHLQALEARLAPPAAACAV